MMISKNGRWRLLWLIVFALLVVGFAAGLVATNQKQEAHVIVSPTPLVRRQQSWEKAVAESVRSSGVNKTVYSAVADPATQTGQATGALYKTVTSLLPSSTPAPGLIVDSNWTSSNGTRPIWLTIPVLGISVVIEELGLNEDGSMAAPTDWSDAGWFEQGYPPGQAGTAVIAGHLDAPGGKPAVFWDLNLLRPEDEIRIEMDNGQIYLYQVERSGSYPHNSAPLDEIFGWSAEPRLALITCQGDWSQGERTYADRLVVFARYSGEIVSKPDALAGKGASR